MCGDEMRRNFPPFAGLKAFFVAAETAGFRRAAEELGVTESAISHEIRRLEAFVGQRLFERKGRNRRLTVQGVEYHRIIAGPMAEIARATELIATRRTHHQVRLTLPPTLAVLWFIPKMESLQRDLPEVSLHLVTTNEVLDLSREEIDLAIRRLPSEKRPADAPCLIREFAFPVCNPRLLSVKTEKQALDLLKRGRILVNDGHPDEWSSWAAEFGRSVKLSSKRQRLIGSDQVLEAAARNLGLAIGRRPLVDPYLLDKRLTAPFGTDYPSGSDYYLITRTSPPISRSAQLVYDWMVGHLSAAAMRT
jgi:LysR family transcriptional regulator, glycine cleavage system transcriptional activator